MTTPKVYTGILAESDKGLLMLCHEGDNGNLFYTPPFAPVEDDTNMRQLAQQYCFIQTGLLVEPKELLYVEESVTPERAFCFWFKAHFLEGEIISAPQNYRGRTFHAMWMDEQTFENTPAIRPLVLKYDYWSRKKLSATDTSVRYLIR